MTKKHKNSKVSIEEKTRRKRLLGVGIIAFVLLIFSSALIYAVNADIVDYFNQSRTADGYGGSALERNSGDFTTNGCGSGTMLDTITGLCWQQDLGGSTMNWTDAQLNCTDSSTAGHSDWRLPTRNELFTLIDQIGSSGATCTTLGGFGFTNCANSYYWSETEYSASSAWDVGFSLGDGTLSKTNPNYATCVRRN